VAQVQDPVLQGIHLGKQTYHQRLKFKYLTDGVDVEYQQNGQTQYKKVQLIDFDKIDDNDWLVVNQFRVKETGKTARIPDVVIFINGLPIAVIELKNATDENATIEGAFNQLQTYKNDISCLFPYNEILVVSDGTQARVGTLTADWERFMPWRSIDGENIIPQKEAELETIIKIYDPLIVFYENPPNTSSLNHYSLKEKATTNGYTSNNIEELIANLSNNPIGIKENEIKLIKKAFTILMLLEKPNINTYNKSEKGNNLSRIDILKTTIKKAQKNEMPNSKIEKRIDNANNNWLYLLIAIFSILLFLNYDKNNFGYGPIRVISFFVSLICIIIYFSNRDRK
jgi:hypothetical protein